MYHLIKIIVLLLLYYFNNTFDNFINKFQYWNNGHERLQVIFVVARYYTTEELAQLLEDEDFWKADVFITPPNDGQDSAEDSGDEDRGTATINNLNGLQLQSQAVAKVSHQGRTFSIGDSSDSDDEYNMPLAELRRKFSNPKQRKWVKNTDLVSNFPTFSHLVQNVQIPDDIVSCFELFFDDSMIEFLKDMIALYASQKGEHNLDVTANEVRCFIAILLLSGYAEVARWRMWWEVNSETCNTSVVNAMRRSRFEKIKKFLHCADNTNLPDNDKFGKVKPYFQKLNEKCRQYSNYPEQFSIDESMIPYFGRHGAKQFLKGKPIRYGYKMWCMCEPSGYVLQFEPYQGKTYTKSDLGVGGSVVMNLVNVLPRGISFKIYGDRFFSSLKLTDKLSEKGIGYTGTIKSNRIEKCPIMPEQHMKKKDRGYFDYCTDTSNNCTVTSWNDNRIVLLVSSCDSTFPIRQANRWVSKEKKKLPVTQPYVVSQYNQFMGGVDRMDENIDNYRVAIRSKKWWWPLFVFGIDIAVHNAWQIYRTRYGDKYDLLAFRRRIVQVYFAKYGTPISTGGRPVSRKELSSRVVSEIRYDRLDHWIVNAERQNRCAFCKKNCTKACEKCHVNLHEACFKKFHIKN